MDIREIETPALMLDVDRLAANAERMRTRCRNLGVALRPHVKTSKSVDVARVALGGKVGPITVSTLREADHFARAGYRDILYAVAIAPGKLGHLHRIQRETGARVSLVVDSVEAAQFVGARFREDGSELRCLIEIDCGEHRSGVPVTGDALAQIGRELRRVSPDLFAGVMTHAGHSYATDRQAELERIAEEERHAAVESAEILSQAGLPCPIISVGSTPTVLRARHLEGVTEVRCGIYLFWDLAQFSCGLCGLDDIGVSVLATVIGHGRSAGSIVIDAGALALSKDLSANTFLPDAKFGFLCDPVTMQRLGNLAVDVVHQEHGTVYVDTATWFDRLPIGSQVRILPNHACLTCAAYDHYVVAGASPHARWARVNGWS